MQHQVLALLLTIPLATATAAQEQVSHAAIFAGDLCLTDTEAFNDFNDCNTIPGNVGLPGVQDFALSGLAPEVAGDGMLRLTVRMADLFEGPATDNPGETFRLIVDGSDYGRLFDGSIAEEAARAPDLAEAVTQAIAQAPGSGGPIDLAMTLPQAVLAEMVSDGSLTVRLDFREDGNINQFLDPMVTLHYPVVPAPAAVEAAQPLAAALSAQTDATARLAEAVERLNRGLGLTE